MINTQYSPINLRSHTTRWNKHDDIAHPRLPLPKNNTRAVGLQTPSKQDLQHNSTTNCPNASRNKHYKLLVKIQIKWTNNVEHKIAEKNSTFQNYGHVKFFDSCKLILILFFQFSLPWYYIFLHYFFVTC